MKTTSERNKKIDYWLSRIPVTVNALVVIYCLILSFNIFGLDFGPHLKPDEVPFSFKLSFAAYEITNTFITITFGLICYRFKFCIYNWLAVFNLLGLNIVNLIAIFTPMDPMVYYFAQLNLLFVLLTATSITLFLIKCWKKQDTVYQKEKPKDHDT